MTSVHSRHHYVNDEKFYFKKHVLNLLTNVEHAEWRRFTINHSEWEYIDAISSRVQEAIVLVFGRLLTKYWPAQHQEALQKAHEHILCSKGRVAEYHLSSLCFGIDDKRIIKTQEIMLNFNQETLAIQERDDVSSMLHFFGEWTLEEPKDTKLVLLLDVLKSVLSYHMKWSYFIAKHASCRYSI